MVRPVRAVLFSVAVLSLLLGATRRRAVAPATDLRLDARRSFAVTDIAILEGFSFKRVMDAVVARSGTRTTALALYQQLFDTQNPKPGLAAPDAPHCDDFATDGVPSFNGYPRRCPTPEGALAKTDPFANDEYLTLALVNRFDLTPPDGANCGQYRAIFAKKMGSPVEKLHIIFEAALPNPHPGAGIEGCRAVAQFWADLSLVASIDERRAQLETFFFKGLPGYSPVFDPANFTLSSTGGIRTLHDTIAPGVTDRFYQFHLAKRCSSSECALIADPGVLENMPFARLFDITDDSARARAFREQFLREVPNLAIRDVNLYFMKTPNEFLMGESNPDLEPLAFDYGVALRRDAAGTFTKRIGDELRKAGSTLTPNEIIVRAETQTCVGCHFISLPVGEGVTFPTTLAANQHMSEHFTERGEAGPRYMISPAMRDVFIPHRMQILKRFLLEGAPPVHSN